MKNYKYWLKIFHKLQIYIYDLDIEVISSNKLVQIILGILLEYNDKLINMRYWYFFYATEENLLKYRDVNKLKTTDNKK